MPKTVALQSRMEHIANILKAKGYNVIDMYEASRPGIQVDAFLYTSNHPDILTSYNNLTETADISLGIGEPEADSLATVMLNVTGLSASQAVAVLEHKLAYRRE